MVRDICVVNISPTLYNPIKTSKPFLGLILSITILNLTSACFIFGMTTRSWTHNFNSEGKTTLFVSDGCFNTTTRQCLYFFCCSSSLLVWPLRVYFMWFEIGCSPQMTSSCRQIQPRAVGMGKVFLLYAANTMLAI